jgi:hypothetical protein
MRKLVLCVGLAGCSVFGDVCDPDRPSHCEGTTRVVCYSGGDGGSPSIGHEPCDVACIDDDDGAVCVLTTDPIAACTTEGEAVCFGNQPTDCAMGFPVQPLAGTECGDGSPACFVCDGFGQCGIREDPLCGPAVRTTCDGTSTIVGCSIGLAGHGPMCGWRIGEYACTPDTTCTTTVSNVIHLFGTATYGLCAVANPPVVDPACLPIPEDQSANGGFATCRGNTMKQCFLGYVIYELECAPGTCTTFVDPTTFQSTGACSGPPSNTLSLKGSPAGA